MVDLPSAPLRVVTSEPPRSAVSPGQVAAPYAELASSLDRLGQAQKAQGQAIAGLGDTAQEFAKPLAKTAAENALRTATRDADGNLQVDRVPIFGAAGDEYARVVKVGAVADAEQQARLADVDMRQKFRDDPGAIDPVTKEPTGGYLAAATAYKKKKVAELSAAAGDEVGNAVGRILDQLTTQTYRGLLNEKENTDLRTADARMTAGMNSAVDDLSGLARGGITSGPSWDAALSKYDTLLREKQANPRLAYPAEQAAYDRENMLGKLSGLAFVSHVDQVYNDKSINPQTGEPNGGYVAARKYAETILTNTDLKLTQAQREAYYHQALGEVRANEAIRRQDIAEVRSAFTELSTASAVGAPIDPNIVNSLIDAAHKAGDPALAARIGASFARKPLNDDHGRLPLIVQAADLAVLRSNIAPSGYKPIVDDAAKKYGVDPIILTRQIWQESGFNPNAVSRAGAAGISQFMPATAARYGVNPLDPASAIPGQARYMSDLLKQFNGNVGLALAGYNWGEGNVANWVKAGANPAAMPAETRNYVAAITGQPIQAWSAGGVMPAISAAPGVDTSPAGAAWLAANRARSLDSQAGKTWTTIMKEYDQNGIRPDDDTVAQVILAGRATQDHGLLEQIAKDMERIGLVQQATQAPIAQQQQIATNLQAAGAHGDLSPGQAAVLKDLERRTAAITKGLADDPVSTAVQNFPDRFSAPPPLNVTDDTALAKGLAYRGQVAQFAQQNWGTAPLSALDSADLATVKAELSKPDPAAQARIFNALQVLPEDVRNATLAKLAGNEPSDMAKVAAGSLITQDPAVATSILRGQMAIKADGRLDPEKADKSGYRDDLDKALPAATFSLAGRTDPSGPYATSVQMVKARYADLMAQQGKTEYSDATLKQAVTDVTGGVLYHNGAPFIAPARGMPQRTFDGVLWGVNENDLAGVTTLNGQKITPEYLRSSAQLESIGDGRYLVRLGNDPLHPIYAYRGGEMDYPRAPQKFILDLRGREPSPAYSPPYDPAIAGYGVR